MSGIQANVESVPRQLGQDVGDGVQISHTAKSDDTLNRYRDKIGKHHPLVFASVEQLHL